MFSVRGDVNKMLLGSFVPSYDNLDEDNEDGLTKPSSDSTSEKNSRPSHDSSLYDETTSPFVTMPVTRTDSDATVRPPPLHNRSSLTNGRYG